MTDHLKIAMRAVQLYAETHPRPPHVTQRQAADMLCVSPPTVSRMVKAGTLRLNKAGMIPISQIDAIIEAEQARVITQPATQTGAQAA